MIAAATAIAISKRVAITGEIPLFLDIADLLLGFPIFPMAEWVFGYVLLASVAY